MHKLVLKIANIFTLLKAIAITSSTFAFPKPLNLLSSTPLIMSNLDVF